MRLLFFGAKGYDKKYFLPLMEQEKYTDIDIKFIEADLTLNTAQLADGYDAVCAFVNMDLGEQTIELLHRCGVRLILMRCAGFNNVDLEKAKEYQIRVARVPGYSPESVAEHAMALALTASRRLHKAYIKVRENNYSLNGLLGVSFYGRTAGVVGTGRIGAAMARICRGFGMKVLAYDRYPNKSLDFVEYVELDELLSRSDLISLHCPLTQETHHMINLETIGKMKDGVILVNTSRGGLIRTDDLIKGIRDNKFFAVGLDVYEEEDDSVFEDLSDEIMQHSTVARLLSFPNVIVTSHQGFFTEEAMRAISETTMENALAFARGEVGPNEL
ncbi:MAG: 2-hydroxyacid dehydrogenase [Clostridiales bacterium]|nr:2-hydroxyacid dehydrogenase [Clostridiales bacterium]